MSVLLAEDQAGMRRATDAVNSVADFPIVPVHLMPASLWFGDFGPWLRQHLDLSPYRPWNTIFLPGDERGAASLGLPVAPPEVDDAQQIDTARALLSCIHDHYAEVRARHRRSDRPAARIRENQPALFPARHRDFSSASAKPAPMFALMPLLMR